MDTQEIIVTVIILAAVAAGVFFLYKKFSHREDNSITPNTETTGNDVTITTPFEETEPVKNPDVVQPETQVVHVDLNDLK